MTKTSIEWTDSTWNPVRGCSKVSAGCQSCYAMKAAHRFSGPGRPYEGLTQLVKGKGPQWTGVVRVVPEKLIEPLTWREPRRVFVNSMSDLFHEEVPTSFIAHVFAVMSACPRHTFQVLTKRPARMAAVLSSPEFWAMVWGFGMEEYWTSSDLVRIDELGPGFPLANVWLGTSVEDQAAADARLPHLLATPAAVRFLSCEPLLGPVDLAGWIRSEFTEPGIGWVIIGGESGPGARPCDVGWIRSLLGQCADAGVAPFVKQIGAKPVTDYRTRPQSEPSYWTSLVRDKKGGAMPEWPEDLRVRQFPEVAHV